MQRSRTRIIFTICLIAAVVLGVMAAKEGIVIAQRAEADTAKGGEHRQNVAADVPNDVPNDAPADAATSVLEVPSESGANNFSRTPNQEDPAIAAGFLPHKALYSIKMASKKSGSQIVNISGQMLYEWETGCQGWTSNHKFNLLYEYADTPPMRVSSDFSTYETFDGGSFNFVSQRKRDGAVFEELRGHAESGKDGAGQALYRMPEGLDFDLPAGTLFPMQHTLAVLRHIRAGDKFFSATIFDGSDQDGPVEINAFIGKALQGVVAPPEQKGIDAVLISSPAHNVRLAFFPLSRQEAIADYEMSLVFHENGIISDMMVDYHDFSVTQSLLALEPMPSSMHCGGAGENTGVE